MFVQRSSDNGIETHSLQLQCAKTADIVNSSLCELRGNSRIPSVWDKDSDMKYDEDKKWFPSGQGPNKEKTYCLNSDSRGAFSMDTEYFLYSFMILAREHVLTLTGGLFPF